MNDHTFDEQTARGWIRGIEHGNSQVREQDIYPRLRAWLERAAPERILEIGCGQGVCSDKIDLSGRVYIGVDPSPVLIDRARELYTTAGREFAVGNAYELPFSEKQFDAVFSVMVWHLLSDLPKAAFELCRVLKPGGHFLIVTANPGARADWEAIYFNQKIDGRRFEGNLVLDGKIFDHDVLYFHTQLEIESALNRAGLQVDTVEPFRKSKPDQAQEYLISMQGTRPASTDSSL